MFMPSHTKKRCGVWDTVASVPTTFLLLFSSPEKRRYPTQPRTSVPTINGGSPQVSPTGWHKETIAKYGKMRTEIILRTHFCFSYLVSLRNEKAFRWNRE